MLGETYALERPQDIEALSRKPKDRKAGSNYECVLASKGTTEDCVFTAIAISLIGFWRERKPIEDDATTEREKHHDCEADSAKLEESRHCQSSFSTMKHSNDILISWS
jgi:hypothetical protein